MTDAFIQIQNLYKIYGPDPSSIMPLVREGQTKDNILTNTGHTVGLQNINLEVEEGSNFVIMGLSASGKSTLIRHLNRLIDPTEGSITIDNIDVMNLKSAELESFRRHRISMVFQRFALLPHYTVLQNISFGLAMQNLPRDIIKSQAHEWLETVGLEGYENHYPANLSGGQQQRVGLARALCPNTDILLMDEPFSALDPLIRAEMQDLLLELKRRLNKTVVFITHDPEEALRLGDQIALLKDGIVIQTGRPKEILLSPDGEYVRDFVRDVNRVRVLSVRDLMRPDQYSIEKTGIEEALRRMREWKTDYAYVFQDNELKGIITRNSLENILKNGADSSWNTLKAAEKIPVLKLETLLRDALSVTLDAEHPIPVISDDGTLCGTLWKDDLIKALVPDVANAGGV